MFLHTRRVKVAKAAHCHGLGVYGIYVCISTILWCSHVTNKRQANVTPSLTLTLPLCSLLSALYLVDFCISYNGCIDWLKGLKYVCIVIPLHYRLVLLYYYFQRYFCRFVHHLYHFYTVYYFHVKPEFICIFTRFTVSLQRKREREIPASQPAI